MSKLNFIEKNIIENNNAVKHLKINGESINDMGTSTIQEVNVIVNENDLKIAVWSMFDNGTYRLGDVLETAKNFEEINENVEVISAINGDYFYMRDLVDVPVNTSVLYGSRILNNKNHAKYQAIKFNNDFKTLEYFKQTTTDDKLYLRVYEEESVVLTEEIFVNEMNKDLAFITNSKMLVDKTEYYVDVKMKLIDKELFFVEGVITNTKTFYKIVSDKISFKNGQKIMISYLIEGLKEDEMALGFDGYIVKNNRVLDFGEMTGQNFEHNVVRHPRTALALDKDNKIMFVTVDGRIPSSVGVDNREFANIINKYGGVYAYNLDGGGSTQVVLRENDELKIVNVPCEMPLRPVTNIIVLYKEK